MYTTQSKVEAMFGITIPAASVSAITSLIAAAKLYIDRYCGKTFEQVSEVRYYDGNGKNEIIIDDFTSISALEVLNQDGSTYRTLTQGIGNDYIILPWNGTAKNSIRLTGRSYPFKFDLGCHRVLKVTGVFGETTTVPADIEIAATKMVGAFFNGTGGEGDLTSVRLGDYAATFAAFDDKADALGIYSILDMHRNIDI